MSPPRFLNKKSIPKAWIRGWTKKKLYYSHSIKTNFTIRGIEYRNPYLLCRILDEVKACLRSPQNLEEIRAHLDPTRKWPRALNYYGSLQLNLFLTPTTSLNFHKGNRDNIAPLGWNQATTNRYWYFSFPETSLTNYDSHIKMNFFFSLFHML